MPLERILARSITGIRPFNELPVDADIWREAHAHHHLHRHLHAVAAHRPGIVYGLEVIASRTKERTAVVAPGVAIDTDGQTIVLGEPVSFTFEEPRQVYIVLSFLRAVDRASAVIVGDGQQYYREVEGRDLRQTRELPSTPYLELARLFRSGADTPVRDAANPFAPGNDELNLLYRSVAFPYCYADVAVGELAYVPRTNAAPWNPNRAGLCNLLREGNRNGCHLAFSGPFNLRAPTVNPADPALLYVAGSQGFQALANEEVEGLRRFLEGGGLLFAEARNENEEFAHNFLDLAGKLGATLRKVEAGHPILSAYHIFALPPSGGAESGSLLADTGAGIFFGTYNYGAAWQGSVERPEAADARERIRQALEFGLNLVVYAAQRRRLRELARLG